MSRMPKDRPRLGRGLSSLINVSREVEEPAPSTTEGTAPPDPAPENLTESGSGALTVRVDQVHPNPHQPRREFKDASLADLAASLKSTGLIQPIVVRPAGDGYELIAGERRLRAAKLAGLVEIPALVRDVDSYTQAQMALIENIQREDLNPLDRAQAYRALIDQLGLTQSELASRLGEDRSSIANFLRLLDLSDPVKALLRDGQLSVGHAKLLAGVSDTREQEKLAQLVVSQGLSVRNLERILQNEPKPTPPARVTTSHAAHIQDMEQSLGRQLGMRVQLRAGIKGKGRLVIHYASLDQFDELLSRLGVRTED